MEKVEVELKFPLENAKELIEKLSNISLPVTSWQKDTYFIPPHRNFIQQSPISEWFRIRESRGEKVVLNYKNWHNKHGECEKAVSCDEAETEIEDVNALRTILRSLDFKEIIVVEKERRNWKHNNAAISVDSVKGLGDFIEIEADGYFINVEKAKEHLYRVLEELEARTGEQNFKGYPHLILEKQGSL